MIGKFIGYIIGIYLIYYIGNIVYDLFLAKEKLLKDDDEGETINMEEFANSDETIKNIKVEDVENVTLPNSYDADENEIYSEPTSTEDYEKNIQKNFEEEETIEALEKEMLAKTNEDLDKTSKALKTVLEKSKVNVISESREFTKNDLLNPEDWTNMMNEAGTKVILTSDKKGHKAYGVAV